MVPKLILTLFVIFSFFQSANLLAFSQPNIYFYTGYSWHYSPKLNIKLSDGEFLLDSPRLSSRALQFPLYYGLGVDFTAPFIFPFSTLGVEFIHDKVYLQNRVEFSVNQSAGNGFINKRPSSTGHQKFHFSMSHGYNFLLIKFSGRLGQFTAPKGKLILFTGIGAGIIIPHIESRLGEILDEHYELQGPALLMEIKLKFPLINRHGMIAGIQMLWGRVHEANVVSGLLTGNFYSIHANLGIFI